MPAQGVHLDVFPTCLPFVNSKQTVTIGPRESALDRRVSLIPRTLNEVTSMSCFYRDFHVHVLQLL